MRIQSLPALQGWRWVIQGFKLLKTQPLSAVAFTFLYLILATVLAFLPIVGGFSPPFLTPLLTVGLMAAFKTIEQGQIPRPSLMFSPFKMGWPILQGLLMLGLVNCVLYVGTLSIASLVDGGTILKVLTGRILPTDPALKNTPWIEAGAVFTMIYIPVQMALWYAPLFSAWHNAKPMQALFYSFVTVWRNKWAFAVYALAWLLVAIVLATFMRVVSGLFGLKGPLAAVLIYPIGFLFLGAVFASMWATYRDVVQTNDEPGSGGASPTPVSEQVFKD